ncbi:MAG: phytanoyl-CoA dioxygenase family protein [Acidimicrobiales bacterium]
MTTSPHHAAPGVEADLARDGFAVVEVLDRAQVQELQGLYQAHVGAHRTSWSAEGVTAATGRHGERDAAVELDAVLRRAVAPRLVPHLPGAPAFFGCFFRKDPGEEGMAFHQDWTYTDERRCSATIAWIPLVDVGPDNGALRVVPGSHAWTTGIRPSGIDDAPPTDPHLDAFAALAVTVELAAGQAVLFHPGLVHGSCDNLGALGRPVVGMALAPGDEPVVHFTQQGDRTTGVAIPRTRFFMDGFHRAGPPLDAVVPWARCVAPDDFDGPLAGAWAEQPVASSGMPPR